MEQIIKAIVNDHHIVDIPGEMELDLIKVDDLHYHLIHDGQSLNIVLLAYNRQQKTLKLDIDGAVYHLEMKDQVDVMVKQMGLNDIVNTDAEDCKAPMPGLVVKVNVKKEQVVVEGEPLLILEAMKMENVIKAAHDGTIEDVLVVAGDKVEKGQVMVTYA